MVSNYVWLRVDIIRRGSRVETHDDSSAKARTKYLRGGLIPCKNVIFLYEYLQQAPLSLGWGVARDAEERIKVTDCYHLPWATLGYAFVMRFLDVSFLSLCRQGTLTIAMIQMLHNVNTKTKLGKLHNPM